MTKQPALWRSQASAGSPHVEASRLASGEGLISSGGFRRASRRTSRPRVTGAVVDIGSGTHGDVLDVAGQDADDQAAGRVAALQRRGHDAVR